MKEIRFRLAQEESDNIGLHANGAHEVTPSVFLSLGLELEEQQYVIILHYLYYS